MLTKTINSYLYVQYNDDDDLQAFVAAYNDLSQQYVDWFNTISLPVYTGPLIVGDLLDWVALGLYGFRRPTLTSGTTRPVGLLDTYLFNTMMLDASARIGATAFSSINDDMFKRIITWGFYKGDGRAFTTTWLKRRIMRFLIGVNGTAPNVADTSQISVTYAAGNAVNIVIANGAFDTSAAPILIQAINQGICELPFQYQFNVSGG